MFHENQFMRRLMSQIKEITPGIPNLIAHNFYKNECIIF